MKKLLISLLSTILIISMFSVVNAATGNINVGASAETVIKGKTFTVTVVGTADNNITAMQAKLNYDSSKLAIEGKSAGNGFSDLSGANEIAISASSSENLSKTGTLYTITFKVLDTAEEGSTTISVTNAILALVNEQATQENTTETSDEVTITIKADDTTIGGDDQDSTGDGEETKNPSNGDNTNTGDNGDNSNSGNEDEEKEPNKDVDTGKDTGEDKETSKDTNKDKNTNKNTNKLPQTGVESTTLIAIVTLGAVAIVSYLSYRKYNNI